jgi:hypothetical protein
LLLVPNLNRINSKYIFLAGRFYNLAQWALSFKYMCIHVCTHFLFKLLLNTNILLSTHAQNSFIFYTNFIVISMPALINYPPTPCYFLIKGYPSSRKWAERPKRCGVEEGSHRTSSEPAHG